MVVLAVSCGTNEPGNDGSQNTVAVKVLEVRHSTVNSKKSYVGIIEESKSVPLSFLVAGTVENVYVEEGEHVSKGRQLAVLNNTAFKNALEAAVAKEKQAKDAFNRLNDVYKNGSLPEIKMVEIETSLAEAQSMAAIAEKNVKDCRLVAPENGVIGRRSVEPGMNVIPGNPAFTLVNIEKVNARIPVPENEIAGLKHGDKALITVAALNNESFKGTIGQKGLLANPLSHTYEIKIGIDNTSGSLMPGMICNVDIMSPDSADVFSVPPRIIQIAGDKHKFVYIADRNAGTVVNRTVETGNLTDGGNIIITKGLNEGDLVIVDGYQKIDNTSKIKIIR